MSYRSNEWAALALVGGSCSLASVAKLPGTHVGAHLVNRKGAMNKQLLKYKTDSNVCAIQAYVCPCLRPPMSGQGVCGEFVVE